MADSYTYIAIRKDLPIPQQIIQATHAQQGIGADKITNTVLISAKDELDLLKLSARFSEIGIEHHTFWEPDIGEHTAIATIPIHPDERGELRKLPLYR